MKLYKIFRSEDECNKFLDDLNILHQIYTKTVTLILDSDLLLYLLVENFLKFSTVKKMVINGQRWFHLNCTNIPISTEHLDVIDQSNLPPEFFRNSARLNNLIEVKFSLSNYLSQEAERNDDPSFQGSGEFMIPLSDITTLRSITVFLGYQYIDYFLNYITDCPDMDKIIIYVKSLLVLQNVIYRINTIEFKVDGDQYYGLLFIITLF